MVKCTMMISSVQCIVLWLLCISCVRCFSDSTHLATTNENHVVQLVRGLKGHVRNQMISILSKSIQRTNQSNPCLNLLQATLQQSNNSPQFEWLMQMYDASGSLPSGLLAGTTSSLGDFDQCLRLSHHQHKSQYCLLTLRARRQRYTDLNFTTSQRDSLSPFDQKLIDRWLAIDNRVPVVIGLCLPNVCTPHQVTNIALNASSLLAHLETNVNYCQGEPQDGVISKIRPLIYSLLVLATLVSLGTFVELLSQTNVGRQWESVWSKTPIRVLCCFSLITNCQRLASIENRVQKVEPRTDSMAYKSYTTVNLDILDGIRVGTILWIIFSHCSAFTQVPLLMKVSPLAHYTDDIIRAKKENWIVSTYLMNTFFAVSIFFMISGILVAYKRKTQRQVKCNLTFHFAHHIAKRVFRISPTFLVVIALTYYFRYLGSGPLFHQDLIEPYVKPCRTNFWYHFFFLQNYLYIDQRCGSHTWYIAADFQLQILAFVIVHVATCCSKKWIAFILGFGLMVISGVLPLALTLLDVGTFPNFDVYINSQHRFPGLDLNLFYYSTYMHMGSFFLGVFVGFILSTSWSFSFIKKNKTLQIVVTVMTVGTCLMIPFAVRFLVFEQHYYQLSPLFTALAFQFFAYIYNGSLAIFIFVCALNPNMMVCRLMAVRFLRPFSRLVFSAYLSHQMLIWFTFQQFQSPFNYDSGSLFSFSAMIIGMTVGVSFLLFILVESPFARISEVIFSHKASQPTVLDSFLVSKLTTTNLHSISTFTKSNTTQPETTNNTHLNNNVLS